MLPQHPLTLKTADSPSFRKSVYDKNGSGAACGCAMSCCNRFACMSASLAENVHLLGAAKKKASSLRTVTEVQGVRRGSWECVIDPSVEGGKYFYHYTTDESRWSPPPIFSDLVRN